MIGAVLPVDCNRGTMPVTDDRRGGTEPDPIRTKPLLQSGVQRLTARGRAGVACGQDGPTKHRDSIGPHDAVFAYHCKLALQKGVPETVEVLMPCNGLDPSGYDRQDRLQLKVPRRTVHAFRSEPKLIDGVVMSVGKQRADGWQLWRAHACIRGQNLSVNRSDRSHHEHRDAGHGAGDTSSRPGARRV